MSAPAFTKGPWFAIAHEYSWQVEGSSLIVAEGVFDEVDARLIAAAPELYEALDALLDAFRIVSDGDADHPAYSLAARAKAKARGEQ